MLKTPAICLAAMLLLTACSTTTPPPAETVETRKPVVQEVKKEPPTQVQPVEPVIVEPPSVEPAPPVRSLQVPPKKYPRIKYGTPKPLVCDRTFPAEGRMKNRPNVQLMWEHYLYPRPEGIWSEIGGLVEVNGNLPFDQGRWTNACTVRLSHMLNKADFKIPRMAGKTVSGGNKDQYIYRLADMESYLIETYGKPDLAITDGTGNSFDLPAKPGIVLLDLPDNSFTGHITIWNGAGTVDGAEIGGYRVLFWEMPCFIPPDREKKLSAEIEDTN